MKRVDIFRKVGRAEDMISMFSLNGKFAAVYTHNLHNMQCEWDVTADWGSTSETMKRVISWLKQTRPEKRFYL